MGQAGAGRGACGVARGVHVLGAIALCVLGSGCHGATRAEVGMSLTVTSSAFRANQTVPREHTCEGADRSPALAWSGAPAGTAAFAIVMDDPDAPRGTWVHWVLWNLPASEHALAPGVPPLERLENGASQGRNDFRRIGWGGPCPPPGPAHHYSFRVYALDAPLELAAGASKASLERAMQGHVLAQGELVGTYARAR